MRKFVIGTFLLTTVVVTGITNAVAADYEVMRCRMFDREMDTNGPMPMGCFIPKAGGVTLETRTLEGLYADNWRLITVHGYKSFGGESVLFFERQKGKK